MPTSSPHWAGTDGNREGRPEGPGSEHEGRAVAGGWREAAGTHIRQGTLAVGSPIWLHVDRPPWLHASGACSPAQS